MQDWGRTGWRRFGVPTSGAMDRLALAHANTLVGNSPDEAGVEFMLRGGAFTVSGAPLLLAVSGPGARLRISGQDVAAGSAGRSEPGDQVVISDVRGGVFAYLAIAGGVAREPELGSRSLHRRSGIGGRPVAEGEMLAVRDPSAAGRPVRTTPLPAMPSGPIRVIPGPQEDCFTREATELLVTTPYRVLPQSDRMGCRMQGARLRHLAGHDIISDGVLPGAIQVPGDGQPIVLFRDGPTTGGYPKIATVISADVDRLAQIPPGSSVRFAGADLGEAVSAARSMRRVLRSLAGRSGGVWIPHTARLLAENLIDGVVDARQDRESHPVARRDGDTGG